MSSCLCGLPKIPRITILSFLLFKFGFHADIEEGLFIYCLDLTQIALKDLD